MDSYRPIDCHLHDYLEIACLYRYRLLLELVDGGRLEADAISTETRPSKEEFLLVASESGQQALRLDLLLAITPLTPGARFGRVLLGNRPKT
ncbi:MULTISPECIES: Rho-binding antiterminator [Tepidimonas]|jgi:Rho-binding antiterminator|uniref:Modulator of Rho-dependent transcription termination (ROF) n=1 Tax=Tepidimonas fonticaldi TaxID=1101373 RepID=A0A554XAP3_9BURK|nr:Rho-binding antiterminator [Tepidimonas fonticaldi]TSE32903.1 Modulator of Rho-dependent transcription termination (ROF) [Tepidimonas fonticaldi]